MIVVFVDAVAAWMYSHLMMMLLLSLILLYLDFPVPECDLPWLRLIRLGYVLGLTTATRKSEKRVHSLRSKLSHRCFAVAVAVAVKEHCDCNMPCESECNNSSNNNA